MVVTRWEKEYIRKKKAKRRLYFSFFIVGMLCGAAGYAVFLSGEFNIQHISIIGNEALSEHALKESMEIFFQNQSNDFIYKFISPKNIIMIDSELLQDYLYQNYSLLAGVVVQKRLPHSLTITVEERDPIFVACQKNNQIVCFYVDRDGVAYEEAPRTSGSLITILEVENNIERGSIVVTGQTARDLKTFQDLLYEKLHLTTKKISVGKLTTSFDLFAGWSIRVDITTSFIDRFDDLALLLNSQLRSTQNLQYIDLTVPNRAYYK